jgi:hypothetical protein
MDLLNIKCPHILTLINYLVLSLDVKTYIKLATFWHLGKGIQIFMLSDRSGQQIVTLTISRSTI